MDNGIANAIWFSKKWDTAVLLIIFTELDVIIEAGPIPKEDDAVITATADSLPTPRLTIIGNIEAINNKLNPAADGMQMYKNWPIGITNEANIYGCFLINDNGFNAK